MTLMQRLSPHFGMAFVVLSWGLNFSIIKLAYHTLNAPTVAFVRLAAMAPLMVLYCVVTKVDLRLEKKDWPPVLLAGFISAGIYMILFLEGMARTGAAQGAIALATAPIFTAFLSILLKQEEFRWNLVWGSLLAFAGVIMVILTGHADREGSWLGALIVLVSAVVWAIGVLLMRPLVGRMEPVKAMTLSLPGAFLALLPYGLMPSIQTDWSKVASESWWALIYLILIAGSTAFVLYYRSVQAIGPTRTAMIQYLVPPTAAICSVFVLGTDITPGQIVGLAVVLVGLAIGQRGPIIPAERSPER